MSHLGSDTRELLDQIAARTLPIREHLDRIHRNPGDQRGTDKWWKDIRVQHTSDVARYIEKLEHRRGDGARERGWAVVRQVLAGTAEEPELTRILDWVLAHLDRRRGDRA